MSQTTFRIEAGTEEVQYQKGERGDYVVLLGDQKVPVKATLWQKFLTAVEDGASIEEALKRVQGYSPSRLGEIKIG